MTILKLSLFQLFQLEPVTTNLVFVSTSYFKTRKFTFPLSADGRTDGRTDWNRYLFIGPHLFRSSPKKGWRIVLYLGQNKQIVSDSHFSRVTQRHTTNTQQSGWRIHLHNRTIWVENRSAVITLGTKALVDFNTFHLAFILQMLLKIVCIHTFIMRMQF